MYSTREELEAFFDALYDMRMMRALGEGAFGLAVLAYDETEQVRKVFKLPKDEKTTEALKVEGANLVKLRNLLHRNIIQLHQYGKVEMEWNGDTRERYYLCLAFGGTCLREKMGDYRVEVDPRGNPHYHGSGEPLPLEEALRISMDVCRGLEAAHGFRDSEIRIIHRDIKPENILIDDETGVARITDFGVSRVIDRSSGIVSVAGTLLYMAPECFKGRANFPSDIYSFGIVMYEMLTGELPFDDYPSRELRPPRDPRELNPDIPPDLAAVVMKALEKELDARYAHASEMLADLRRVAAALNPLPDRYAKLERLGSGRLLCRDTRTDETVVVHLAETDVALPDMAREAASITETEEPGIVPPLRHFRNEHVLGMVCEPPRGESLLETFGDDGPTTPEQLGRFCDTMAAVCDIMDTAHQGGVLHGHLNPGLIHSDAAGRVTVHGFGLAPVVEACGRTPEGRRAFPGAFSDSLPYMSPGLLDGATAPTAADDVYALGAVMFRVLTGEAPPEESGDLRPAALREKNRFVTRRLTATVMDAMAPAPEDRPDSLREVAERLRECRWPEDVIETIVEDALAAYEAGDALEAYELLNKGLEADPGNPRIHHAKGLIYLREEEFTWAARELQSAANIEPGHEVLALLGRCLMRLDGRADQAVRVLERALEYDDDPETREFLARALRACGRRDEAVTALRQSIPGEPDESVRSRRKSTLEVWEAETRPPADARGATEEQPPEDEH